MSHHRSTTFAEIDVYRCNRSQYQRHTAKLIGHCRTLWLPRTTAYATTNTIHLNKTNLDNNSVTSSQTWTDPVHDAKLSVTLHRCTGSHEITITRVGVLFTIYIYNMNTIQINIIIQSIISSIMYNAPASKSTNRVREAISGAFIQSHATDASSPKFTVFPVQTPTHHYSWRR